MTASNSEVCLDEALEQTRTYHPALEAEALADALESLVTARRQSLWLICRYLADLADAGRCKAIGYDDVFEYAWKELAMRRRTVLERVRVGRALRHLPAIEDAFVTGRVGFGRVREIVRVATPETEQAWLTAALELPMRVLEAEVAQAGGIRPTRHAARVRDAGDGFLEVRLVLPTEVWEAVEDAMNLVAATGGSGIDRAEALARVAELARAHAAATEGAANVSPNPNHGVDGHDGDTSEEADPIGNADVRSPIRTSGAARDCSGGPAIRMPPPVEEAPAEDGLIGGWWRLTHAARAMIKVVDRKRKWGPDELGYEAGIQSGAAIATALSELEMAGFLEKVSGGYRVVPARRRPRA